MSSNSVVSSGFEDEKPPWTIIAQDSKGQLFKKNTAQKRHVGSKQKLAFKKRHTQQFIISWVHY